MESYSFLTEWKLRAPVQDVWRTILQAEEWPQWWKGVKQAKVLRAGNASATGSITYYEMGTFFYSLQFMMKVVDVEPYRYIKGIAEGDLIGTGMWELEEEDGIVTVRYYWNVETTIGWMNRWAWLLKPVFELSHNLVMSWGGKGLARKLGTKLLR
jgi:uncharacterized protein YndB with AHSA1/START domain